MKKTFLDNDDEFHRYKPEPADVLEQHEGGAA